MSTSRPHRCAVFVMNLGIGCGIVFGLVSAALSVADLLGVTPLTAGVVAFLSGVAGDAGARRYLSRAVMVVASMAVPVVAVLTVGKLLVIPVDLLVPVSFTVGLSLASAARHRSRWSVVSITLAMTGVTCVGAVAGAGAWSVDEPGPTDPRMVAGNGIVVSLDTHAFLIQQGAVILRNDGHLAIARFLATPDPTAPYARDAQGRPVHVRESYLWRMQLGARDADRGLKSTEMPDHFFNWWTHSGKGLIAGPSAATYAEQQFAKAVDRWRTGDRSQAMYHLGAATHLVDDACAPPHESIFVPNHRAYEEWMLARQDLVAVDRGGIYQSDFRVTTGHGGPEWSSAHTRGWVDECAHRAAELVINTAQPPPDDPTATGPLDNTKDHFEDTQRLTAGYLVFFFDSVGGPR